MRNLELERGIPNSGYMDPGYIAELMHLTLDAICSVIKGYSHVNVPFPEEGASYQRVLTPNKIIEGGMGNCIEGSILATSFLEFAGFDPVIFSNKNHAWPGVLIAADYTDDVPKSIPADIQKEYGQYIVKVRLNDGEAYCLPIESTNLTAKNIEYSV
jgi:hypothetical protein